jgi:hypothetical protein
MAQTAVGCVARRLLDGDHDDAANGLGSMASLFGKIAFAVARITALRSTGCNDWLAGPSLRKKVYQTVLSGK